MESKMKMRHSFASTAGVGEKLSSLDSLAASHHDPREMGVERGVSGTDQVESKALTRDAEPKGQ